MQFRFQGEALRLRRRIEVPIGGSEIRITDVVENLGATATPQASLYHFNLGYPAIAPGTTVRLGGKQLFGVKALPDPSADTESVSYPAGDVERAVCTVSTPGAGGDGVNIAFAFATRHASASADLARFSPARLRARHRALHQRENRRCGADPRARRATPV